MSIIFKQDDNIWKVFIENLCYYDFSEGNDYRPSEG